MRSATLSPGGEAEQPPQSSPRCWGHRSPFLPFRRRRDGSSGTQCSPGGSGGLQAPVTAAVTPTSPTWGCGCSEPCCPHAEPAVPTLLATTAAGQALAAAPLCVGGQAGRARADPLPRPHHALGVVAPTEINTARGYALALSPWFFSSLYGVHWSWGVSGCAVPPALPVLVQPLGAPPEGTGVSR